MTNDNNDNDDSDDSNASQINKTAYHFVVKFRASKCSAVELYMSAFLCNIFFSIFLSSAVPRVRATSLILRSYVN